MLTRFVCALLIFCVHEFPVKCETREPGEIIVEHSLYCMKRRQGFGIIVSE